MVKSVGLFILSTNEFNRRYLRYKPCYRSDLILMGGGAAMRAAAKVAGVGVLNSGENLVTAARQATRSVAASVVSSSDDLKLAIASNDCNTNSPVEKSFDDWEFAGGSDEDEMFMELREPMPRLVFGSVPSLQEAKQATSDLNYALEKTYLYPNNGEKLSDSENVETKSCLVTEAPFASKHAIQAFRLLNENPKAQTVVASIASDPNVWNAVLQNPDLVDFLNNHKTEVVFPETEFNESESSNNNPKASESKGFMDYVDDIKQKITVKVTDMMNTLSDTLQSFFGGLTTKDEFTVNSDGSAGISVEKATMGVFMGLAIMVISVVVFKRAN